MDEVKETRRSRMLILAAELGSLEALAEVTGTSARYLSQIKNRWKGRGMGRTMARRIDARLRKPMGWMDQPLPQGGPENEIQQPLKIYRLGPDVQSRILDLFDQLTGAQQDNFLREIEEAVENNKAIMKEMGTRGPLLQK